MVPSFILSDLHYFLGKGTDEKLQKSILNESETFKDIIQGDFFDTYHNLSYKVGHRDKNKVLSSIRSHFGVNH